MNPILVKRIVSLVFDFLHELVKISFDNNSQNPVDVVQSKSVDILVQAEQPRDNESISNSESFPVEIGMFLEQRKAYLEEQLNKHFTKPMFKDHALSSYVVLATILFELLTLVNAFLKFTLKKVNTKNEDAIFKSTEPFEKAYKVVEATNSDYQTTLTFSNERLAAEMFMRLLVENRAFDFSKLNLKRKDHFQIAKTVTLLYAKGASKGLIYLFMSIVLFSETTAKEKTLKDETLEDMYKRKTKEAQMVHGNYVNICQPLIAQLSADTWKAVTKKEDNLPESLKPLVKRDLTGFFYFLCHLKFESPYWIKLITQFEGHVWGVLPEGLTNTEREIKERLKDTEQVNLAQTLVYPILTDYKPLKGYCRLAFLLLKWQQLQLLPHKNKDAAFYDDFNKKKKQ